MAAQASMHPKKFASIMALSGPDRTEYTIKRIADMEIVWGLWSEGWAAGALDEDKTDVFPIWPDREFAVASAEAEWSEYEAREIPLEDFVKTLLPNLAENGILVGVFRVPSQEPYVQLSVEEFLELLNDELEQYS